jgi:hypothetical protein
MVRGMAVWLAGWAVVVSPLALAAPTETPQPPGGDAATPAPGPGETQLLERIRQLKGEQWRTYGACRYAWARWRLGDNGVRLTDLQCGPEWAQKGTVAVHCDSLRINRKMGDAAWEAWRLPLAGSESSSSGGEDLMVAALCANLKPAAPSAPAATPASPAPAAAPAPAS